MPLKMNKKLIDVVTRTLCLMGIFILPIQLNASELAIKEVAEGVYVHHGKHVSFEDEGHDDIANIGFIVGENCIAVIDTGGSLAVGKALQEAIKSVSSLPVCYVINTHVHFDHVLGNAVFKSDNTKFIGHHQLAGEMTMNIDFFLDEYGEELGGDKNPASIIIPDTAVEESMEIDLGNRILELHAYPPAHTRTDLSIYDRKTKTLWLSDLLFDERIPVLDGSLRGWLKVMDKFEMVDAQYVIPGHGRTDLQPAVLYEAQRTYLENLLNQTRKMIQQGAFMEEVIETVGKEEKQAWLLYDQHHKRNVSLAFIELEWE